MKKFALTLLTALSLSLQGNAFVTTGLTLGNGALGFAAGTIVFGYSVSKIDYSKDAFDNTLKIILGSILSVITFSSDNSTMVLKPINPQLKENQLLGLTAQQISAYNSNLPLINGLFQSLNQTNASLEEKVAYLKNNKHLINSDAQVVLAKLFSVSK